jgi:protein-tyrosine phosphatase
MSSSTPLTRRLAWEGCYNARDVAGFPTRDGSQIRPAALVRTDNLSRLTPEAQQALIDYGVRTIIDLRRSQELLELPSPFATPRSEPNAPTFHHLSLMNENNPEGIRRVDSSATMFEMYQAMLDEFGAEIATIIRTVAQAPEGGVLVHCFVGKDRTGVIVALLLSLAGVEEHIIAEDYSLSADNLEPLYQEIYKRLEGNTAYLERFKLHTVSPYGDMIQTLAYLNERYGGAESYLRSHGISDEEFAAIRKRLRQDA